MNNYLTSNPTDKALNIKHIAALLLVLLVSVGYSHNGDLVGVTSYCINSQSATVSSDDITINLQGQIEEAIIDELQKATALYQGQNNCSLTSPNFYLFSVTVLQVENTSGTLGYAIGYGSRIYKNTLFDSSILFMDGTSVATIGNGLDSLKEFLVKIALEKFEYILLEIRSNNPQTSNPTTQQTQLNNQTVTTTPATQPTTPSNPDLVESTIDGRFTGFDGATTITLANGQQWQQIDATTSSYSANSPSVTIRKHGAFWKLKVDGVSKEVTVMRLQ